MMMTKECALLKARAEFQGMIELVQQATKDGLRIDEVERDLWQQLLAIGRAMLEAFVADAGDGDAGETIEHRGQRLHRLNEPSARRYVSIFGALRISRPVYAAREKQRAVAPLDARLGLPQEDFSYVLTDWLQQACVRGSFAEAVTWLAKMLGLNLNVHSAEHMNQQLAVHTEMFRQAQPAPKSREEESILVATTDCKGVPMRRPIEERARRGVRRRKGEKANKKQMAAVGAVYSIAPYVRTPDDVIDELARQTRAAERPRPRYKHLWAELTRVREGEEFSGKERLFVEMALEVQQRDPKRHKALVCLSDGERALWELQKDWLGRAIGILDLFHVLERLWGVAYCFHAEGSEEAEQFVAHRLRMLLEGKVGYVIGGLKRLRERHALRGEKRRTVTATIRYYENNRQHMRYDEYLAAGYPIGSGVAEGACRHLVKDRLEGTGMRWTVAGAQAMLSLRAIHLNGDWDNFITHHIETEQAALYAQLAA
jgi:hypothetical protein